MSEVQKIIKYCAMTFAIFLTFNIIGGIFLGIGAIGNIFDESDEKADPKDLEILKVNKDNFKELDIDVISSSIVIKEGEKFRVETNNKYVNVYEDEDALEIEEKEHFINNTDYTIIVYIPYEYSFSEVSIDGGAGKIEVEKLTTRDISLDLGAGKVEIGYLNVLKDADIDGGAGAIEIKNSAINNLDLDMGVGKFTMKTKLTGNNDIDAGVGECDITLIGSEDDYMIRVNKGIGEAIIDGKEISNNSYSGTGSTNVYIDGGVEERLK